MSFEKYILVTTYKHYDHSNNKIKYFITGAAPKYTEIEPIKDYESIPDQIIDDEDFISNISLHDSRYFRIGYTGPARLILISDELKIKKYIIEYKPKIFNCLEKYLIKDLNNLLNLYIEESIDYSEDNKNLLQIYNFKHYFGNFICIKINLVSIIKN